MSNDEKSLLDVDELQCLPLMEIKNRGICNDHIESGNDFMENGIQQIIKHTFKIERTIRNERNKTEEDKKIKSITVSINITSVDIQPPTTTNYITSQEEIITPRIALLEDKTYASAVFCNMDILAVAQLHDGNILERKATVNRLLIANIPIMVHSNLCNIHNKSHETLLRTGEDPSDLGGYYIVKGVEWVINSMENSAFNNPKYFRNVGYKHERAWSEVISKPGDAYENSTQIIVKMLTGNRIIVIIHRNPFTEVHIPFYLLFRLLGWSSDKQIVDWLVREYDSDISKRMVDTIQQAFEAKYSFGDAMHLYSMDDILQLFLNRMSSTYGYLDVSDEKSLQFAYSKIISAIDVLLLPHIGSTPEHRNEKAIYLSYLIRNTMLVEMKVNPETDRDVLKNKRAHSAGVSFAKAFKQQFGFAIDQPIKKRFAKDFKSTTFSNVDLVQSLKSAVNSVDFERALSQSITTGSKQQITMKKTGYKMINRLSSQQLHRKNNANYISTMRMLNMSNTEASNQSARSSQMRRVHPTYTGYICPIQCPDGPKVGIVKQLAISASVTLCSSGVVIKEVLSSDPDFIMLSRVTPDMLVQGVAPVKVNGHWYGCVWNSHSFADKYRQYRRELKLNPYISIMWDPENSEVSIWTDAGRLVRPLMIVYNNNDPNDFKQWVTITSDHLNKLKSGVITMKDLLESRIIEYISAGEQENMLISLSHDVLWKNRNNPLLRYTHCDVPIAIFGMGALNCVFGSHSPGIRVVYSTRQLIQTCSWYSLSWPFRIDKEGFLQYHCELPLLKTVCNDYMHPSGQNCIVAILMYSGYNQEDSIIMNKGAIQRGLFDNAHLTFMKSELEKNEYFGNPDITSTSDIKSNVSYEKIVNGFPAVNTIMEKNDVIIGKYIKSSKSPTHAFADRSIVYRHEESARVINVYVGRNQDGKQFAKVQLLITRECIIGDKYSMRSGQKGVVGNVMAERDMPFTESGVVPDVIFNPLSLPKRMTINTILEILLAKVCASRATTSDGTMFRRLDIREVQRNMRGLGFNPSGTEKLYNGMTGQALECEIFIGPMYYQRLQKYVSDTIYAVSRGATDALTRKPLDGKSSNGGFRVGEMEKDAIISSGVPRFLSEKFYDHADGFESYMCRVCGNYAVVNHKIKHYLCTTCKDNADITSVNTSWSSKLFMQEMNAMNIGVKSIMSPYMYEKNS